MANREEQKESLWQWLVATRKELNNVTWPSREEVLNLTAVVFIVTIAVATYLGVIDYALSQGISFILKLNN